jgi:hypothetical protein
LGDKFRGGLGRGKRLVFGIEDELVLEADGAKIDQNLQNYRMDRMKKIG